MSRDKVKKLSVINVMNFLLLFQLNNFKESNIMNLNTISVKTFHLNSLFIVVLLFRIDTVLVVNNSSCLMSFLVVFDLFLFLYGFVVGLLVPLLEGTKLKEFLRTSCFILNSLTIWLLVYTHDEYENNNTLNY